MSLFGKNQPPQPVPVASTDNTFRYSDVGKRRIAELRGDGGAAPLFTSDLSVNEFLMVERAGFRPLGLVMASSVYHIGYQSQSYKVSQELTVLSQAMYTARELAMTRMEGEAAALGADGVVGVRLNITKYEFSDDVTEFIAVGTAVKHKGGGMFLNVQGKPFTSDLSGQDFAVLLASGHRPVGLVMGTCVYHIAHQSFRQWMAQSSLASFEMGGSFHAGALRRARDRDGADAGRGQGALGHGGSSGVQVTEEPQAAGTATSSSTWRSERPS